MTDVRQATSKFYGGKQQSYQENLAGFGRVYSNVMISVSIDDHLAK